MPDNVSTQQGDIRDSQQIADNTTGEGTSQLYQDFMSGKIKESSLTAAERMRLRSEDTTKNLRPLSGAETNLMAHVSNAVTGPKNVYGLPEGYGESRQDRKIYRSSMLDDLNESRAILQSDGSKLFNGLVKGFGTFITTGVDAAGLGQLAYVGSLVQQGINGEFKLKPGETVNNMLNRVQYNAQNNAFQHACNDFNNWLEEKAPNYYRAGEQELGFWQSLGNANFWGNDFIKNLGFMVGALVGAKVNGAMMGKLFNLNKSRNVVRNALKSYQAETGTKLNTRTLASAFSAGQTEIGGMKISQALGNAARKSVRNEFVMTMLSGLIASDVEARQEGSSNSEEFVRNAKERLDEMRSLEKRDIDDRLEKEHPELFITAPDENPENGMFRGRMTRQVNPDMMEEYGRLHAEMENKIDERYANMDENVMIEAQKFANADYWANMPILYAENLLLWGSFLKGSYATGRVTNGLIKTTKAGKPIVSMLRVAGRVAKGLGSPLYEGAQEFLQENMNQAATKRASARLNTFYGEAFDPQINADLAEGIQGFLKYVPQSFVEGFTDPNTMKQFYVGTLTAMLGVPSMTHVSRAQNTRAGKRYEQMTADEKRKWHEDNRSKGKLNAFFKEHAFSIQGEMFDTFRETSEEYREAKELVEKYNDITTNDRFKTVYQGVARGQVILRDMDNAVVAGDKNAYISEQEKQLLNIVDTYQRLGRTDELKDTIESFRKSDIGEVRDWTRDTEGKSQYDGVSDEQMGKNIDKWADALEHTISKYDEIMRNLKVTFGDNVSDSVLTELTWKTFHLDNLNERFKETYGKIHDWLFGSEGVLNGRADGLFGERMSEKQLEDLERLRLIDAKSLLEVASSKEVYDTLNSLGRLVESSGNVSQISPQYDEVRAMMEDLSKLYNERIRFADDYLALAADYKNMEDYDVGLAFEVDEARIRSLIAPYISGQKKFSTPKELYDFLNQHSELDGVRVLDELSKYGEYKDLVERTREWAKAAMRLESAVKNSDKKNPFYGKVAQAINNIINTAQSPEQIRAALEAYAKLDGLSDGEKALVRDILNRYDDIVKTGRLQEPDPMAEQDSEGGHDSGEDVTEETGKGTPVEDGAPPSAPASFTPTSAAEDAFSNIMRATSENDLKKIAEEIKKNGDITESESETLNDIINQRIKDLRVTDHTLSRAEQSRTGENSNLADSSEKAANSDAESINSALFVSLDLASLQMKVADVIKESAEAFVTNGGLSNAVKNNTKVHFIKLGDRTGDAIYAAIEHKEGSVHAVVGGKDRTFQIIGAVQADRNNTTSLTLQTRVQKAFEREFKGKKGGVQVLEGLTSSVREVGGGYMSRAASTGRVVSGNRFDGKRMSVFVYTPDGKAGSVRHVAGSMSADINNILGLESVKNNARNGTGVLLLAVRGADGYWMAAPLELGNLEMAAGVLSGKSALGKKLNGIINNINGATNSADRMAASYELSRYISMSAEQIYSAAQEASGNETAFWNRIHGASLRLDDRIFAEGGKDMTDFISGTVFRAGVEGTDIHSPRIVLGRLENGGKSDEENPSSTPPEVRDKKEEEKKKEEKKPRPEKKMGGGEGSRRKVVTSKWYGDHIIAEFIFDSKGNLIDESYKKNGVEITDEDEIATCHFVYQCMGQLGAKPATWHNYPGDGFVSILPSGKEIMYYNDSFKAGRWSTDKDQIAKWKEDLDRKLGISAKEKALDDMEKEMEKDSGGSKDDVNPQLNDEEKDKQASANQYDQKQGEPPKYRTVVIDGHTYGVLEDNTVFSLDELNENGGTTDDWDWYIYTHPVNKADIRNKVLNSLGIEENPFDTTNDTKTDPVPDNEEEHSAEEDRKEAEKHEKDEADDPFDNAGEPLSPTDSLALTATPEMIENLQSDKFKSAIRGLRSKRGDTPFKNFNEKSFDNVKAFIVNWNNCVNVYNLWLPDTKLMKADSFKTFDELMSYIDHLFACGF